jgi:DNA-binding NarL/FixJ family response regulator
MDIIKVLIAEDEDLFRQMLSTQLSSYPGIQVVGEASSGEEAIELAATLEPEVVLMDIELGGGLNGIQAGKTIRSAAPTTGIVLLSAHKEFGATFLDEQPSGWSYLLKKNIRDTHALASAIKGSSWWMAAIDPELVDEPSPGLDTPLGKLNEEQLRILEMVVKGYTDAAIASRLRLADESSVKEHLDVIYNAFDIPLEGEIDPRVKVASVYLDQTRSR